MNLKNEIDINRIPNHVAIIMDGNGRWANSRGLSRINGHKKGVNSVRNVVEAASELKICALTLYTFSTENWKRPKSEVNILMAILVNSLKKELKLFQKHDIKLQAGAPLSFRASIIRSAPYFSSMDSD